jgi:quinol monooxygenase YgiN
MIQAFLLLKVYPEKQDKAFEIINFLQERIQVESGCVSCDFYQDLANKSIFLLLEEWESRADLDRHIHSEEYRHILALIELSSEPPIIKFNTVKRAEGIEAIESVRK